ncbi:MAG: uncharacterized protein KVP18_003105 [Porospora cf. gigantea A]|uniref:uncharacterized protein n=1 Tax=Porospora cf. gigantea A TaxID=2853593 RepID=UPI00355AC137|nr:MAG: hypothetical protein KVP18_003105 [Porospora cf. gigantea A]
MSMHAVRLNGACHAVCKYIKESLKKIEDSDGSLDRLYRTFRLQLETCSPAKAAEECALLVAQSAVSTSDSDRN